MDLTTETAAVCATNVEWATDVIGSKGDKYTVRFCHQPRGRVQYDYECTCWSFKAKRQHCKHIQKVIRERLRCAWNDAQDPGSTPDGSKCPRCGGPLHYLRVGV